MTTPNGTDERTPAMAEIRRLVEAVANGRLQERGNAGLFAGSEAELIRDVNQMLDAVTGPLRVAARSLEQIARGTIPEFVVDEYPGELNEIKKSVNTFLATMYGMHYEIGSFVEAIKNGKLKTRANDWDFEGRWRELLAGLNEAIDTFIDPFETAAAYVKRISRGDIPAGVAERYRGDFNELKRSLNILIVAVNALVADADGLCKAAVAGQLSTRADASAHGGDFRKIVDGVNLAMDAVTGPLRRSASVLDRVAQGDLTAELSGDYEGDFAKLQTDINTMVRNLQRSMQEIAATAETLASSSRQLSGISQQLAGTAEHTASRATEALQASEQVASSVQVVAAGSETVLASMQQTVAETNEASRITADAVVAAEAASGTVSKLGASSRSVGEITSVITSITAETGALAGQADREAARASQAGRGFAAVAGEVQRLAQSTRSVAENIGETVQQMSRVLDQLTGAGGQAGGTEELLLQLRNSNTEIVGAAKTISTLAWQSRLLAFNAKIEATHAVEAGLSFSEVAKGVKTLSERTAGAAGEINQQLGAIRGGSEAAIAAIGKMGGLTQRIDAISRVTAAGVEKQARTTEEMRTNLTGAAAATQAIAENISDVARATGNTTSLAEQTEQAAGALNEVAKRMQGLVAGFRT